ncbi:60S ribosomal protein L6 [Culex quinquefasciatus]|uniref:60S ribosomal protein L6 n=1 Tax=Culex quinquefasciatus TaxID=7176 RepID=B0W9C2_CULQU|nr:60S ribosomal protein L6 [Culex quinquefasciatus]|eukprot:XP_001845306.1 60S ribosomal protein L6 [Culex quinquefasciatus]
MACQQIRGKVRVELDDDAFDNSRIGVLDARGERRCGPPRTSRATITLIVAKLPSHDPVFIICRMAIFQNARPPFTSKCCALMHTCFEMDTTHNQGKSQREKGCSRTASRTCYLPEKNVASRRGRSPPGRRTQAQESEEAEDSLTVVEQVGGTKNDWNRSGKRNHKTLKKSKVLILLVNVGTAVPFDVSCRTALLRLGPAQSQNPKLNDGLLAHIRSEKGIIVEKAEKYLQSEKRIADQKTFDEELLKAKKTYPEAKVTRQYLNLSEIVDIVLKQQLTKNCQHICTPSVGKNKIKLIVIEACECGWNSERIRPK